MSQNPVPSETPIEARVDVILSWLLRVGVLVCAAVIALGWAGTLLKPDASSVTPQAFSLTALTGGAMVPEGAVTRSLAGVFSGLARRSSRAVIVAGLMLLIALPLARVALTAVTFAIEGDWLYVALALAVLTLLVSGLLLGRAL